MRILLWIRSSDSIIHDHWDHFAKTLLMISLITYYHPFAFLSQERWKIELSHLKPLIVTYLEPLNGKKIQSLSRLNYIYYFNSLRPFESAIQTIKILIVKSCQLKNILLTVLAFLFCRILPGTYSLCCGPCFQ